jgi:hypothetical protein
MKISIFVEGYTELAFVREFLLRHYEFNGIDILCQKLKSGQYSSTKYDFPNSSAFFDKNNNDKYLIVDCGGDQITSKILKREKYLIENNFDKIIGLRDVYSFEFRKEISSSFDRNLVSDFISYNQEIISENSHSGNTILCFAVMEIESWYIGMPNIFSKKSKKLNAVLLHNLYDENDPEEIFKPSSIIESVYKIVGEVYQKKGAQSDSLSNYPTKADYQNLYNSDNCSSFTFFCNTLGININ